MDDLTKSISLVNVSYLRLVMAIPETGADSCRGTPGRTEVT